MLEAATLLLAPRLEEGELSGHRVKGAILLLEVRVGGEEEGRGGGQGRSS